MHVEPFGSRGMGLRQEPVRLLRQLNTCAVRLLRQLNTCAAALLAQAAGVAEQHSCALRGRPPKTRASRPFRARPRAHPSRNRRGRRSDCGRRAAARSKGAAAGGRAVAFVLAPTWVRRAEHGDLLHQRDRAVAQPPELAPRVPPALVGAVHAEREQQREDEGGLLQELHDRAVGVGGDLLEEAVGRRKMLRGARADKQMQGGIPGEETGKRAVRRCLLRGSSLLTGAA
jgi:hypothetical protein